MNLSQALVWIMWSMIAREVPGWQQNPNGEGATKYRADIERMVRVDAKVTKPGYLVNPTVDRAILGGVRFFESRFQSKPRDGDCIKHWHRYMHLPSGQWPSGYTPVLTTKCPAKGPMQIAEGNLGVLPAWEETRILFDGIKPWKQEVESGANEWRLKKLTVDEARDPELNVRLGYATIWHWKNTCKTGRGDPRSSPVGAWLTAFGWGKCPPPNWRTVLYVDREGRRRCEKITTILRALEKLSKKPEAQFEFTVPEQWWCGDEKTVKPWPDEPPAALARAAD